MSEDGRRNLGQAWELFAIMDGGKLKSLVAKNPNRRQVIDITEEIGKLLAECKGSSSMPETALDAEAEE
jgi:hypothetical protein